MSAAIRKNSPGFLKSYFSIFYLFFYGQKILSINKFIKNKKQYLWEEKSMAGNISTKGDIFTVCTCKNKPGSICGKCMRDIQIAEKRRKEGRKN
jgi:hypothetical protein